MLLPHRKPTRSSSCVVFRCVSEVTGGPTTTSPIFLIPDSPTTLKFLTSKRPATHLYKRYFYFNGTSVPLPPKTATSPVNEDLQTVDPRLQDL
uniref:SFRICE_005258 n=1 Tax=Spodoptera frugiperda TaxID=7108 RepID=A0A2H1VBL9_SPOFR